MIHTLAEFEALWAPEAEATQKVLKAITDKSLPFASGPEDRTVGRLAWHVVTTIPEMMGRTGLTFTGVSAEAPVPGTAEEIFSAYNNAASALLAQIKSSWTDESLQSEDDMYGEKWKRSMTLQALILHQVHHRGQLTTLMRLAGLPVPGVYGPSREEWAAFGMKPPSV
jgi:uncharacterized damage-inducible protein DinB